MENYLSSQMESILQLQTSPNTITDFKRLGDEMFIAKNYLGAYHYYTKLLQGDELTSNPDILRKRAFSLYNLGAVKKGIQDCDRILDLSSSLAVSSVESIITLKTKCLWGLNKYSEALEWLESQQNPSSVLREWIQKAKNVVQNSRGHFDIDALFKLSKKASSEQQGQFVGEYRSDSFRVSEISGKGRGLLATKRIAAGELVIVSKAWEIVFTGDTTIKRSEDSQDWDEYRTLLNWKIFQKLQILDEDEIRDFCGLSVDSRTRKDSDWLGKQFVKEGKNGGEWDKKEILNEIDYRILNNGFSRGRKFWGVFILPSLINHSCVDCNVFRHTFGDLMVIRAVKDIKKGEELTISYVPPTHSSRVEILSQHKIPCDCRLCLVQKSDHKNPSTAKMMEELLQSISNRPPPTPNGKLELVKKLASLRPPPAQPNLQLIDSRINSLAARLFAEEELKEASEIFSFQREVYKSFGMMREMVEVDLNLFKANLDLVDLRKAQGWIEELKKDLTKAYGIVSIVPLRKHPVVKDLEDCGISFLNLINNPNMVKMLVAR